MPNTAYPDPGALPPEDRELLVVYAKASDRGPR